MGKREIRGQKSEIRRQCVLGTRQLFDRLRTGRASRQEAADSEQQVAR